LDIAGTHFHQGIIKSEDLNTHSDSRELKRWYMIININLVESKIINMLGDFFGKTEQIKFSLIL